MGKMQVLKLTSFPLRFVHALWKYIIDFTENSNSPKFYIRVHIILFVRVIVLCNLKYTFYRLFSFETALLSFPKFLSSSQISTFIFSAGKFKIRYDSNEFPYFQQFGNLKHVLSIRIN